MIRKSLVKWVGGVLALALGFSLLPVGTGNSKAGMVTAQAAGEVVIHRTTEEGPDDYDLGMTEEQLLYMYLTQGETEWGEDYIGWVGEPVERGVDFTMDRAIETEGGEEEALWRVVWKYEGVCIRKAPVVGSAYYSLEEQEFISENPDVVNIPVQDSKMLHFSNGGHDYYVGKCYVVYMDYDEEGEVSYSYSKAGCLESVDKKSKETSVLELVAMFSESDVIRETLGDEMDSMRSFYKAMRYAVAKLPGSAEKPATSETSTTPAKDDVSYTVKKGDTLSSIATKFYGNNASRYKIKSYNKAAFQKSKGKLAPGMEILIPASINGQKRLPEISLAEGEKLYTVKLGDSLFKIAQAQLGDGNRYKEIFKRNSDRIKKATQIYEGQEIVIPAK